MLRGFYEKSLTNDAVAGFCENRLAIVARMSCLEGNRGSPTLVFREKTTYIAIVRGSQRNLRVVYVSG